MRTAPRLVWQTWRWAAYTRARLRTGSAFLPRAITIPATSVAEIGNRKLLFALAGTARLRWLAGRSVDGDWDRSTTPVEEHPAYRSFDHRFRGGARWKETSYWQAIVRDIENGVPRIGCRTTNDIERKFSSFDELWETIGTAAYGPRGGLAYRPWEEVLLGLGRSGNLVLVDGRHRLIIGHLKRCSLPVLLVLRHVESPPRSAQRAR